MRASIGRRTSEKEVLRFKKRLRIRRRLIGTAERPRVAVFRSTRQLSVQVIDDTLGKTLVAACTGSMKVKSKTNLEAAAALGKEIARLAQEKNIKNIVFDRSGYLYHGRIKAIADAAREGGLEF